MDVEKLQSHFEKGTKWQSSFFFIQAADTQLGLIDAYILRKPDPGWDPEIKLVTQMVAAVNRMDPPPKFLIVCGDLVNAFPGEENRTEQVSDHKRLFAQLKSDIPLVCVCGNHDVGDEPTPQSISQFRKDFGPDYFSFEVSGVLMIVINSQYYADRSHVEELAKEFDDWLEETLKKVKNYKHTIVFQHIPYFLEDPEEPDHEYFNIKTNYRMKILNKLYDAGVRNVFTGHYHRNGGGMYKEMQQIVTSAVGAQLGEDESGVRIITVSKDAVRHRYYDLNRIPVEVALPQ